ncbi:DUF6632 domain-containing protein [Streptosporangium subroseum]|uniref:DUF6632 domain-containing protein n=1 Tax=Streptosporangium subroseum TaxID=106412 RepID=UPI00343ABC74
MGYALFFGTAGEAGMKHPSGSALKGSNMTQERRLQVALIVVGIVFVAGVYPLINLWPAGFRWQPEQPEYEQMIVVIYAVLGIFLIRASRDPFNPSAGGEQGERTGSHRDGQCEPAGQRWVDGHGGAPFPMFECRPTSSWADLGSFLPRALSPLRTTKSHKRCSSYVPGDGLATRRDRLIYGC